MTRRHPLRSLLADFAPADRREARFQRRMLDLTEAPGDPFSRNHFVPGHFTASAFVLSPSEESLLLILHGKLGLWLQPGGHIDPEDSDVFAAARREVREEVGIDQIEWAEGGPSLFDLDIHTIPARPGKEPAHEHFDLRVFLRAPHLGFTVGSDAKDARWVALDKISLEISDESVMRAVRKLGRRA